MAYPIARYKPLQKTNQTHLGGSKLQNRLNKRKRIILKPGALQLVTPGKVDLVAAHGRDPPEEKGSIDPPVSLGIGKVLLQVGKGKVVHGLSMDERLPP